MQSAPTKPTPALSLALAGKRRIEPEALGSMKAALALAFDSMAGRLAELMLLAEQAHEPMAARFCGDTAKLTLISGLADGVDQVGADLFLAPATDTATVRRVLGAVLPCSREDFVENSHVGERESFNRLWDKCAFIVDVGAQMPPSPSTLPPGSLTPAEAETSRRMRGYAFSAQSEVLLRNADILLAVDDPEDAGKAGGTRESVRRALDVGMPVVFLRLGEPGIALLRTRADFDEPRMLVSDAEAREALRAMIDEIIGYRAALRDDDYVRSQFAEFFCGDMRNAGRLGGLWTRFEACFKRDAAGSPEVSSQPEPVAYAAYKQRASDLSGAYAGQYRGSFLAGYGLAVLAVAVAVTSLLILAIAGPLNIQWWIELTLLLGLGLVKLLAVTGIFILARRAHGSKLAHRAADFRYLSERLRAMQFLPAAGWLRAPANWSLPYTTRLAAQGVMDQLFAAIVRQADPLEVLGGTCGTRLVRLDPATAEAVIRDQWLAEQGRYHQRNQATLARLSEFLERANRRTNLLVIWVAGMDLVLLLAVALRIPPGLNLDPMHAVLTPLLITLAAILPAAVASLNGVRFQSECTRLADRSKQMSEELCRLSATPKDRGDRAPRMMEVQRLAEDATRLTLGEVAEWSAIYGKDFPEI